MEQHKSKLIIRVDGSSEIGLGHISRCCALADMLKNDFEIYFYTRANAQPVIDDIEQYCVHAFKLDNSISYKEEATQWVSFLQGNEIVVLDGYNFDTNYQQQIKNKGCKLVCIDDIHAYRFVADVVINHAPDIDKKKYSVNAGTKLYLGTGYVLLKKIFLNEAAKPGKTFNFHQSGILICFGGADPNNVTMQTLQEVMHVFPSKKINVITGAAYMHQHYLGQLVKTNQQVLLHTNIKSAEVLALMKQSHIGIVSASTTALEYICAKGNLFLKCTADNQKEIYQSLIEKQCAQPYELLKNYDSFKEIINNQYQLIDGKSGDLILKIFNQLTLN